MAQSSEKSSQNIEQQNMLKTELDQAQQTIKNQSNQID